jgi:pimeloyl-ACP methyl ester carboxylesterase
MSGTTTVKFLGAEGNTIVADCYGASGGQLAILLHGGGQTRHSWRRTADALARRGYHAVVYDHRGHGDSDWVSSGRYELPDFAADLCAVVGQLDPGSAPALVGASLGGLTSLTAVGGAMLSPISAIVLADVVHRANPAGAGQLRSFMDANPDGYATLEEAAAAIEQHMPHRTGRRNLEGLARNMRQRADGRWRWHWDPAFMAKRQSSGQRFGGGSPQLLDAIRNIDVPLLLARGDRSEIVTPELAKEFRVLLPSADYVELEGVGHMVSGDDNAPFTRVLVDYLEKHCRGARQ